MKTPYQQYYSKSYSNNKNLHIHLEGVHAIRSKISSVPFSPEVKILDLACGTGLLGKTFSNQVYGIDLNPEAVNLAKKNGVNAKIGNIEKNWGYPKESFDIVLASHIIEHVVNPDALILQAKKVLKKHGLLIIVTPNLAAWFNRILLVLGSQPMFTEVSTIDKTLGLKGFKNLAHTTSPVGHLRIFTLDSLKEILELHGFTVINTSGVGFGAFPKLPRLIDQLFAHVPGLSASIIAIGKKS